MTPEQIKHLCEARDKGLRLQRRSNSDPCEGLWFHDPEPLPECFPDDSYRIHEDDLDEAYGFGLPKSKR